MSFDWAQYLNLAKDLIRDKDKLSSEEACLRAAISRSYYSAYCTARNRARDLESLMLSKTGEDHRKVVEHYIRSSEYKKKKIGSDLDRLRIDRAKADYNDRINNLGKMSSISTQMAERILGLIKRL